MQRLSGIATLTRQFVDAAADRIVVLDTRKTTPLMRILEKYAVRAGGGTNHRFGLDDGILIKDNHVRLAGGVAAAVERMRSANQNLPVEVEAQSLCEVDAALDAGADIVLLDNLSTADIIEAVGKCRGKARTEVSGGVTLARMAPLTPTFAAALRFPSDPTRVSADYEHRSPPRLATGAHYRAPRSRWTIGLDAGCKKH